MFSRSADSAFRRFRSTGDPAALAKVFDRTAPELLRLARHLVRHEAGAEDLVQATFVTVIEDAADHDGQRPVLPWLLGVLANHARVARRAARRVVDPDRLAPTASLDAPDPLEAAMHGELRVELDAAIESLPEPYQPVLRLSLDHGLEPTEIGEALGRPAGTVRAQLSRGLDRLRRALPAGVASVGVATAVSVTAARGLAAVRTEVLQRCGVEVGSSVAAATTVAGVLTIMGTKTVMTVGAGALVALAAWFAFDGFSASRSEPEREDDATGQHATASFGETAQPDVGIADAEGARQPVVVARPDEQPADEIAEAVPTLTLRVVRLADKTPLDGVAVSLRLLRGSDLTRRGPNARTGADGVVKFESPPVGKLLVNIARIGSVRMVETAVGEDADVTVEVPAGIEVRGRVVDAAGSPAPNARILLHGVMLEPAELGAADSAGRFTLRDVGNGAVLEARADRHGPSLAHPVRGMPGSAIDLVLELGAVGRRIVGRVVDSDGQPGRESLIAAVDEDASPPNSAKPHARPGFTRTDANGRFELDAPADRRLLLIAIPKDRDTWSAASMRISAGRADAAVDFELPRGAVIEGRVVGVDEVPEDSSVMTWQPGAAADFGYVLNLLGHSTTMVAEDGTFRITGLLAGRSELTLRAGQHESKRVVELAAGVTEHCEFDLRVGLTTKVIITPRRPAVDGLAPMWNARLYRVDPAGRGKEFVSYHPVDYDGVAEFGGLAPGQYVVTIGAMSSSASMCDLTIATHGPFEPGRGDVELTIDASQLPDAKLTGRLLDTAGAPIANEPLRLMLPGDGNMSFWQSTSDADGKFSFGPLMAGQWQLQRGDWKGPIIHRPAAIARGEQRDLGDVVVKR